MENQLSQARAPIFEALRAFSKERVVPFDVPGHKHGKGNPELTEFLGQATMDADVNSMKPRCWLRKPSVQHMLSSWSAERPAPCRP